MKRALALAFALALALCCACAQKEAVTPFTEITLPPATAAPVFARTPAPTPQPTTSAAAEAPSPAAEAASPTPGAASATLGFVGDIMAMAVQISGAKTEAGYDFSQSFAPMAEAFSSVDFLAGNFECTLAGEAAGYSQPKETAPPASEANPMPKAPLQKFSAPDALARDLREAGFDLLATANNHCMDKGVEGLYRTARVIREAGIMQLGTYLDEADAKTPRVASVNGIRVGFVAASALINSGVPTLTSAEREYAVAKLEDMESIAASIAACRQAGAEFVVVLVHWGEEHSQKQNGAQEKYADALIAVGADAIVGTHPHVAEPIEWREGERNGKTVCVPVAYSLGNFISNMAQKNVNYGVFLRLTLEKSASGEVVCAKLAYLPLLCYRDEVHRVAPCFAGDAGEAARAYAHVTEVCSGADIAPIARGELFSYARKASINQGAQ
ncbi:MAG TPA: CapA family protein [Clostridia bacterium]|nr:CapA family protein [Clostridia bacterium]